MFKTYVTTPERKLHSWKPLGQKSNEKQEAEASGKVIVREQGKECEKRY